MPLATTGRTVQQALTEESRDQPAPRGNARELDDGTLLASRRHQANASVAGGTQEVKDANNKQNNAQSTPKEEVRRSDATRANDEDAKKQQQITQQTKDETDSGRQTDTTKHQKRTDQSIKQGESGLKRFRNENKQSQKSSSRQSDNNERDSDLWGSSGRSLDRSDRNSFTQQDSFRSPRQFSSPQAPMPGGVFSGLAAGAAAEGLRENSRRQNERPSLWERAKEKSSEWKEDANEWNDDVRREDDKPGLWERAKEKGAELKEEAKEWYNEHVRSSDNDYRRSDRAFDGDDRSDSRRRSRDEGNDHSFTDRQWRDRNSSRNDNRDSRDNQGLWERAKEKTAELKEDAKEWYDDKFRSSDNERRDFDGNGQSRFYDAPRQVVDDIVAGAPVRRESMQGFVEDNKSGLWQRANEKSAEYKEDAKEWCDDKFKRSDRDSFDRREFNRDSSRNGRFNERSFNDGQWQNREVDDIVAGAPIRRESLQDVVDNKFGDRRDSSWSRDFSRRRDDQFNDEPKGLWERAKEKGAELKEEAKEWYDDKFNNSDDDRFERQADRFQQRDRNGDWRSNDFNSGSRRLREYDNERSSNERQWRDRDFNGRREVVDDIVAGAPVRRESLQGVVEDKFDDSRDIFRGNNGQRGERFEGEQKPGLWERAKEKTAELKEDAKEWYDDKFRTSDNERRGFDNRADDRFQQQRAGSPTLDKDLRSGKWTQEDGTAATSSQSRRALIDRNQATSRDNQQDEQQEQQSSRGLFSFVTDKWNALTHAKSQSDYTPENRFQYQQRLLQKENESTHSTNFNQQQLRSPTSPNSQRTDDAWLQRSSSPNVRRPGSQEESSSPRTPMQGGWVREGEAEFMDSSAFNAWEKYRLALARGLRNREYQIESDADAPVLGVDVSSPTDTYARSWTGRNQGWNRW